MAAAVLPSPHSVHTTLNYFTSTDGGPPFYYTFDPPSGGPRTNIGSDTKSVEIIDLRGKENSVSLDVNGFKFMKHESQEKEFTDDEKIKNVYFKEVEELVKKETGAKRIFIFDHTLRRALADSYNKGPDGQIHRGPAERVHVDQSDKAGIERVYYHLPEEASRLTQSRVRIINVWRPIANPVHHKPLALCDYRTVNPELDLVPSRLIYPYREGSNYMVRYNPNHKFYYVSEMQTDEVVLIKCFDSEEVAGRARLTPHSAFRDDSSPAEAPQRQSIEVRCLVFDEE